MHGNLNRLDFPNPLEQNGGTVWHRLHSEREDICEALLKAPASDNEILIADDMSKEQAMKAESYRRSLLQARLRKVDDALDRLLAGSFGNCSRCGNWIEDTKLDFDPAIALCFGCWVRMQTEH